jgi:hypothetical protein
LYFLWSSSKLDVPAGTWARPFLDDVIANKLEDRLGRLHAKQRSRIVKDHEAQIFGQGINFFYIETWYSIHSLIRNVH